MSVRDTAQDVHDKIATKWGAWRRFIAAHPLTGFWAGVIVVGVPLGWVAGRSHWPF